MQKGERDFQFQLFLDTFPPVVRKYLQSILLTGEMLGSEPCKTVTNALNISIEDLMLRLLPLAKLFSATTISNFQVGAVAKARMSQKNSKIALFLGANIEFPSQPLIQTIHAEQSAIINAWLQGAHHIEALAITAAPCGYCRQFLYELKGSQHLEIILHNSVSGNTSQHQLSNYLPEAFGPHELGQSTGLMASPARNTNIRLESTSNDPLVWDALSAARKSYAPYSGNYAGCIIKTNQGKEYAGRYAENAAFNPSLSPLHTAIIRMNMENLNLENKIVRSVLVERPTSISQRAVCELLLKTVAPEVNLEYHEAI